MSTGVPRTMGRTAPPSPAVARIAAGVIGVLAMAAGVALLLHPAAAAGALAVLIGLGLVLAGAVEITAEWAGGRRGAALALGGLLVLGGALALVWPKVTLVTLAVLVAAVLIVHGVLRIAMALAVSAGTPGRGWLAAAGGVNVLIGLVALLWPQMTVLMLSVLLGVQVVLFAALMLALAFLPRRAAAGAG
ncbi:DUF308 domain-containing protein [Amnibacterium kyonggiense]|uniref:Uncharacterized membrane protein HdeD (DUF308 family) n=1 Tax=Amnibacterium kyonggiense TaxID=595671 RepID=A0A4R7FPF2_9MICO|nr:DUF308 domain-containing protein [Amnibacterium kyonggiense]TDS79536.1 uncharacterized membrane protein HdeD (DUF308 family) [Amnibacterium kyonggiense]